ncbi:hypothetical protein HMPREF3191_01264 [Veillonellaceae bacterium DNF00626]|nr:hypothetical protein HMPREF3191_01264 [Veillonellaceae bacterium DNF00626]
MNKIFKIIWNTSKQAYVVVSEFANVSGGKKKLAAAVLAFVMGMSAGTSVAYAWSRSEENLMAEVMKRIDAKYVKDGRNITIGQETESGLNSITIGRMARAAYSRPGNDGWENKKTTYTLSGENKNAVAIGTNSLAGASNIASIIPANETTYFNYSSIANLAGQVVYYRT